MEYLAIIDELFHSDTALFLFPALLIFVVVARILDTRKRIAIGLGISVGIYCICEVLIRLIHDFGVEFISLLVGTVALGAALGLIVGLILSFFRE